MKTRYNHCRRCSQCNRLFIPDPRVDDRQVTCGDAECQRTRHADRCRSWHGANVDVTRSHYEDVVVPFREVQPDYQRRWRLAGRLREIREKMKPTGGMLLASLRALLRRAETLSESATRGVQSGVLAGNLLEEAAAALRGVIAAFEQLEASMSALRSMGL